MVNNLTTHSLKAYPINRERHWTLPAEVLTEDFNECEGLVIEASVKQATGQVAHSDH